MLYVAINAIVFIKTFSNLLQINVAIQKDPTIGYILFIAVIIEPLYTPCKK